MKLKKIISMGCAMALISAGIVLPAGATDTIYTVDPDAANTPAVLETLDNPVVFKYSGKVEQGQIKVTVKHSGAVYINPYNIEVTSNGTEIGTDSVITPVQYIKNESNTAIGVSIKGTPTPDAGSGAQLKTKAQMEADPAPTDKSASFIFEIMETDTDSPNPGDPELDWTEAKSVDIVDKNNTLTDTEFVLAKKEGSTLGYAAFRITGDAVADPENAGTPTPWTAADTVDVDLAFTFVPVANGSSSASALTADNTTITAGETATVTAALPGGATIASIAWSCDESLGAITDNGDNATATFTSYYAGTCTITAVITDSDGATHNETIDITIQ